MKRVCAAYVLLIFAITATAEESSRVPGPRSESLELPGLTAGCHVCEWRPKFNQMPAFNECGTSASGDVSVGLFECGFAADCKRECRFIRCGTL